MQQDKRADYYWRKVRTQGERYREFHWSSVELLLNLIYSYDVVSSYLATSLNKHNLSLSALNVLMILSRSENKSCPLHELGELLLVSRSNITGLIDCLEKKGLVERVAVADDRRVRLAQITSAGEKLLESFLPDHYAEIHQLCGAL